jgi:hypothetical protein
MLIKIINFHGDLLSKALLCVGDFLLSHWLIHQGNGESIGPLGFGEKPSACWAKLQNIQKMVKNTLEKEN